MEQKDRYLLAEFICTFALLHMMALVFKGAFGEYQLLLSAGLAAGFAFSWQLRNKQFPAARISVNIAAIASCVWILYNLLNSSFYYTEVILIFLKGGILLEVILSFDSYASSSLSYLQALSLPLLMCFPLFTKDYDLIHMAGVLLYFACWAAIFRIKFYGVFRPVPVKGAAVFRQYSFLFALGMFAAVMAISMALFRSWGLGKLEQQGILPMSEGKSIKMKEDSAEKEYYALQDQLQNEVMKLVPDIKYQKDRQEVLFQLSAIIKESPNVMEVKKAHQGLVDFFKRPGEGLEFKNTQNVTMLLEEYLDKKTEVQLKRVKDNMVAKAKNNPFHIREKLSLVDRANKMHQESSYRRLQKLQEEVNEVTDGSGVGVDVKKEMKALAKQMKELKSLQFYRFYKKILEEKGKALDEQLQEELKRMIATIEQMQKEAQVSAAEKREEDLQAKAALEELRQMFDMKLEMLLAGRSAELKEKIEKAQISEAAIRQLLELMEKMETAKKAQGLSEQALALREKASEEGADIDAQLKELLALKIQATLRQLKQEIREAMKENRLPDSGREFLEALSQVKPDKDAQEMLFHIQKLKNAVEKAANEGFVSTGVKEAVEEKLSQMQELFILKTIIEKGVSERQRRKETNYQQELRELIESTSFRQERKDNLQQFAESIFQSQSMRQLDQLEKAVRQELQAVLQERAPKEEVKKVDDGFAKAIQIQRAKLLDKMLAELQKKIEQLQEVAPEEAQRLRELAREIRNSASVQEMRENIEKLQQEIQALQQQMQERQEEKKEEEKSPWEVHVVPNRAVMPLGSSASLKAVGIFNKIFIRELSAELEWFSSDPGVVEIDARKGAARAVSKGTALVTCTYRGQESRAAQITVVDKTQDAVAQAVKKELAR